MPPQQTVEEHAREQATFVQEKLGPRLEQARRGRRQVYFVDAAHFVFPPFLGCLWCGCGCSCGRPRVASGTTSWGALCGDTRLVRLTNHDYINAESVCACARWRRPVWGCRSRWCWTTRDQKFARAGAGVVVGDRTVVPARLLAQPESDRETVAGRAQARGTPSTTKICAIHGCDRSVPGDLPTVHKGEMATLMTPKFQTFGDVPLLAA